MLKVPKLSRHFILDDMCKYQVYQPTTPRISREGDIIKSRIRVFLLANEKQKGSGRLDRSEKTQSNERLGKQSTC
jgi:hypothetical protein